MADGAAGRIQETGRPDSPDRGDPAGQRLTGWRCTLPQLPGGDEPDTDKFAPAPDQRAYPPHLAARGEGKAEHLGNREVAHIQAGAVVGNVEDVALDPRRIRRRDQESLLAQVDPNELAGTKVFAVSRHDFSCAGEIHKRNT